MKNSTLSSTLLGISLVVLIAVITVLIYESFQPTPIPPPKKPCIETQRMWNEEDHQTEIIWIIDGKPYLTKSTPGGSREIVGLVDRFIDSTKLKPLSKTQKDER